MGMDATSNPGVMGLVGGALLGAMLAKNQKPVAAPPAAPPATAPQPAHGPDVMGLLNNTQAQAGAEPSTFLTGPGGVDPKKLKVVRPSLYGGNDTQSGGT